VLTLIRRSLQRAIRGPVQLNRHPCRLPTGSAPGLSLHLASRSPVWRLSRQKSAVFFGAAVAWLFSNLIAELS
ncbi:hypothetical protein KDX38_23905, partial [Pseudomonas sp. CDFA 602]|nr:hypothetical protein [Pseudomonas californiensis]